MVRPSRSYRAGNLATSSILVGMERASYGASAAGGSRGRHDRFDWAGTVARAVLATVWAWAGVAKLADPSGAVLSVRAYRLLPEVLVRPVAWGLPYLELAVAVLLLAGI